MLPHLLKTLDPFEWLGCCLAIALQMTRNVDGVDVLQTWLSDFQLHADMLVCVYCVNEPTERISLQDS